MKMSTMVPLLVGLMLIFSSSGLDASIYQFQGSITYITNLSVGNVGDSFTAYFDTGNPYDPDPADWLKFVVNGTDIITAPTPSGTLNGQPFYTRPYNPPNQNTTITNQTANSVKVDAYRWFQYLDDQGNSTGAGSQRFYLFASSGSGYLTYSGGPSVTGTEINFQGSINSVSIVPIPASAVLLLTGFIGLVGIERVKAKFFAKRG